MVPLGRAESWPFLRLFELGVRNLCTCERLRAIAAVFYLSFLLFSVVVVVGVSCFQLWEMLGQVKEIDFGVCKLLTQVVHVTLDIFLAKVSARPSLQCYMLQCRSTALAKKIETDTQAKQRRVHAREITRLRHVRVDLPASCSSRLHCDSDLTRSVDHTHCCTLHALAQLSFVWTRSVWWIEPVEERPVGERQWAWTVGKTRKIPLLSIKTQQRADTTRSRRDNKFSSHAGGNTKPGWTSSFSPSSWRGHRHACRRPHLFQWRTREKVLGGTKSGSVLSAVQQYISSCEFRIKRCTVLCFRMWLQRLVV